MQTAFVPLLLLLAQTPPGVAQPPALTLADALARARLSNAELVAARAEGRAAAAAARQAGTLPNPNLALGRERTSGAPGGTDQTTIQLEQALEFSGARSADRAAARARAASAEADVIRVGQRLDARVTRAFVRLVAARRRVGLAERLRALTDSASVIVGRRFDAGDASGLDRRRVELDATRYAAAALAARFEADSVAAELGALVGVDDPSRLQPVDSIPLPPVVPPLDSLLDRVDRRQDVQSRRHLVDAASADATARSRERLPVPVVSAGFKSESAAGSAGRANGFVAGLSLPLALWDRRGAALANRQAVVDLARADAERVRRDAEIEVRRLAEGVRSLLAQRALFGARLGAEADAALQAVAVAFAEGELPVVQWLDAVRSYHEARSMLVHLEAEIATRWADLAAAVGGSLDAPPVEGGT